MSGQTKCPIFNINTFNLGDAFQDDPMTEFVFKAYKLHVVRGKEVTDQIGQASIALNVLHLTQYDTKIKKPVTLQQG